MTLPTFILLAVAMPAPAHAHESHVGADGQAVACEETQAGRSSGGKLLWNGDFETGALGQWVNFQGQLSDRAKIVTSPVTQGKHALSLTTKYGDLNLAGSGTPTNRAQLNGPYVHKPAQEDYTRVSIRVPSGFPTGSADRDFQLAWQWHGQPWGGVQSSPPIELAMTKDRSQWFVGYNPVYPNGSKDGSQRYMRAKYLPLTKDTWHHFVFRVKWSHWESVGFFEMWHAEEGHPMTKVTFTGGPGAGTQRISGPTLSEEMTDGIAPRAANYRLQETTRQDGTIYYDGIKVGTTFESVAP